MIEAAFVLAIVWLFYAVRSKPEPVKIRRRRGRHAA